MTIFAPIRTSAKSRVISQSNFPTAFNVLHMEFSTARKTIKGRTFSNYFISNLLSILPAQWRDVEFIKIDLYLGHAENKIYHFLFRKRTFQSILMSLARRLSC